MVKSEAGWNIFEVVGRKKPSKLWVVGTRAGIAQTKIEPWAICGDDVKTVRYSPHSDSARWIWCISSLLGYPALNRTYILTSRGVRRGVEPIPTYMRPEVHEAIYSSFRRPSHSEP